MQSAAAPGNQTLLQTDLIHAGFARQLVSRQDVADPVCWRLYIPLFSVTSMSCRVSARFPLGWPHAARHHPGWFCTNRPTIIPLQMAVSCAGDQGCCFHGGTYTIPLVSSPTTKIQTKINLESDFPFPTCWPLGALHPLLCAGNLELPLWLFPSNVPGAAGAAELPKPFPCLVGKHYF